LISQANLNFEINIREMSMWFSLFMIFYCITTLPLSTTKD